MQYLGVDLGLKRIGLAVSEGKLASPWKVLEVRGFTEAVNSILQIIQTAAFDKIIVGLPEGKMGQNVQGFIKILIAKGIDVETADETLSSKTAKRIMIEQGIPQKKRRFEDAYSAAEILQNYLDNL